jgi:acyl-CoA hydrolase
MVREPKTIEESATETVQVVLPNDANPHGTVLGGTVMHWMDLAAAMTAHRHARCPVVTASVDSIQFVAPIGVGHVAILRARLTHVGKSSMEVKVDVDSEDPNTGDRNHTSTAFFTFVAVDKDGKPCGVPPLRLENDTERSEFQRAGERRMRRLSDRGRGGSSVSHA